MDKSIIFFGDPMCSWCWGFAPVMKEIAQTYGDQVPISTVVGGLRAGTVNPMDDEAKTAIRGHWEEVEKTTGQTFDYSFFDREGFVYDTELPCRAVVAMRKLKPEATLGYFALLHGAFYAVNQDITDLDVLTELAEKFEVDGETFRETWDSGEVKQETYKDFVSAKQLGIAGFPTLVLRDGTQLKALNRGYCGFDVLKPALDKWMTEPVPVGNPA